MSGKLQSASTCQTWEAALVGLPGGNALMNDKANRWTRLLAVNSPARWATSTAWGLTSLTRNSRRDH